MLSTYYMYKMRKLSAQRQIWNYLTIISCIFYGMTSGNSKVLVNNINVFVNDNVSIHCYTNSSIDIQWHFNSFLNYVYAGRRLYHASERFRTEYDNAGTHILIITNARSEDAGVYYCSEEISGRQISSTQLTVAYSDLTCYSNMHPDGFIGPNTCNLEQENMAFNCVISFSGSSPPHLMWRSWKSGLFFNSSTCEDRQNRRNCSLILKSDPIHDESIFICETTASVVWSNEPVKIYCSTESIKIAYIFETNDVAKKYVNDIANCSAKTNLNIKYNWTLQENGEKYVNLNRNLLILKPGTYQCKVNYSIRNFSCSSQASVVYAIVEGTNGGTTSVASAIYTVGVLLFIAIGLVFTVWFVNRRRTLVNKMEPSSDRQYQDIKRTDDVINDRELSGYYEDIELREEEYQELRSSEINTYLEMDVTDHYTDIDPQLEDVIE